jgi:subtilisin-like proprotein convertase family protein/subtilisin family serine protease
MKQYGLLLITIVILLTTWLPATPDDPLQDAIHLSFHRGRVIVKFEDSAKVRLRTEGLVSLTGADMGPFKRVLSVFTHPEIEKLFTRDEGQIDQDIREASQRSGRKLADLNGYYEMIVDPEEVERFIQSLEDLDVVQLIYPTPLPVPPPEDIPPETPDFELGQRYLDPAPEGIDARAAWSNSGGRGEGVTIIDIEYDWRDTHEDLENALGQKLCYAPRGLWIDHGTAVLGEVGSGDNGYGVTGIANEAGLGMVTQYPSGMSNSVARAIDCATSLLDAGDVILLEAQTGGPHGNYVPVEWNQAEYDAIVAATAKGIIVVEAAGNGNENLDHPDFLGKFDRSVRDSGAIIVGAGAPPDYSQPDRSRLSFSTYGSRVDVQGYGQLVTTTGYGDLFAADADQLYTDTFSGTSSASPIVTGAAAALQGIQLARGGTLLEPNEVRRILTDTGTPQQDGPYSGHIGPRPDLLRAIDELSVLYVTDLAVDDTAPFGNEDGILDPGESATIRLTVENLGGETAQSLKGSMTSNLEYTIKITDHIADWPDLEPSASAESLPPHHRLTAQPGAACGTRVQLTVNLTSDPYLESGSISLELGQTMDIYPSSDTPLTVPKKSNSGILSSIDVPDGFTIKDVQATVDIVHGDIGELMVMLESPSGTTVTLHDNSSSGTANLNTTYDRESAPDGPGTMNDFNDESSLGTWILQVVDDKAGPVKPGILSSWSLELTATDVIRCHPLSCSEPIPDAMDNSLRVSPAGIEDLQFTWETQTGAAEYRIWRSTMLTMDDAILVDQTSESSLVEIGGLSDPEILVFYQVRAVNSCNWEGP